MQLNLVVIQGTGRGEVISVRGSEFSIGRDPGCDLHLPSPVVSRRHAKLVVSNDKVLLCDLGSRNGTFINGQLVRTECEIKPNDWVRVGTSEYWIQLHGSQVPAQLPQVEDRTEVLSLSDLPSSPVPPSPVPAKTAADCSLPKKWRVCSALAACFGFGASNG